MNTISNDRLREIVADTTQPLAHQASQEERKAMAAELLAARERIDDLYCDVVFAGVIPQCDLCEWHSDLVPSLAESAALVRTHLDHCPEMAKRVAPAIARAEKAEAERDAARKILDAALGELPIGNLRTHTWESIPDRINSFGALLAEARDEAFAERDAARAEVERLKKRIIELDCRYTMGDVADISGSHCPIEETCVRCQADATTELAINQDIELTEMRAEVERLRAELAAINAELAETDECLTGVAGVRHVQDSLAAMAGVAGRLTAELAEAKAQLAARQEPPSDAEIEAWRKEAAPWPGCAAIRNLDGEKLKVVLDEALALMRRTRPDDGELVMSKREAEELMRCYRILDQVHSGRGPSNTYIGSILESTRAALAARKGAK